MSDWVAYVGPFQFPWGQPGSRRVYGIARSLAQAGRRVLVASGDEGPATLTPLPGVDGPGSIAYVGLGELPSPGWSRLSRAALYLLHWGRRTVAWLDAQPTPPTHVIVYGGGAQYMAAVRSWCRRHKVPVIADVVEWYQPHHLRGGRFGAANLNANLALHHHYPRCDGVIAVSSFLHRHFTALGCRTLRVPPTLDARAVPADPPPSRRRGLSLLYSGTPGKKDLLADIVRAVGRADTRGDRTELRVYGPSAQEVHRLLGRHSVPPNVRLHGRVPQTQVPAVLRHADFSLLLREPLRFAQAGFPTKFCESMATGTPVIANLTSDLEHYLHDGAEGLVCRSASADALCETVRRAMTMPADDLARMRRAARTRALTSFDYRNYTAALDDFLTTVRT